MSSPLAILHVALNPITGVWSVMRELAKAQAASELYAGVGIGVISSKDWPLEYDEELNRTKLPVYRASTVKVFGTAQFLWQRFQRPPLDSWMEKLMIHAGAERCVVHFHNAWLSGVFLPLAQVTQGRAKAVATFHGVNAHFRRQPIRRRIHRWMAGRLIKYQAILTSVDRANLKRAESLLGMNPDKFKVIPNGIADTHYRACPCLNGAKTFTVGHVGSIMSAKGWLLLVQAVKDLREKGCAIDVVLAGDGAEAERARALAKDGGGWLVYEGFVPNPREAVMPRLDALVLMSEQEGLPMAIIEALSVGLPVIATSVGGIPEVVADGRNGLLVVRTVADLSRALKSLIDDRRLLETMSMQARRDFEQRYEISKIVSHYDEAYQSGV